jgi:hypothetical protein
MFLMANRTGTVIHHVRFVQIVFSFLRCDLRLFLVALLAPPINRSEIDPMMEPVFQDGFEFRESQVIGGDTGFGVTLRAILRDRGVTARNGSGVEEFFVAVPLKKNDAREAAGEREEAGAEARNPPWMLPFVITEIAFVTLGDLLLGASRRGHGLNS